MAKKKPKKRIRQKQAKKAAELRQLRQQIEEAKLALANSTRTSQGMLRKLHDLEVVADYNADRARKALARLKSLQECLATYTEAADEAEERAYCAEEMLWKTERQVADLLHELPDPRDPISECYLLCGALNLALKHAERHSHKVALLSLEIVGAAEIEAAQRVIEERLLKATRDSDLLAHMGDHRYSIMVTENPGEQVTDIITRHLGPRLEQSLSQPIALRERVIQPLVVMAVSIYPDDSTCAVGMMHHCEDLLHDSVEEGLAGLH